MKNPGIVLARVYDALLAQFELVPSDDLRLPRQRFWHLGELAFDSELFAVHAENIYPGLPGRQTPGYQEATRGIVMYAMDISVSILRDVAGMDNAGLSPSAEMLTSAAQRSAADAMYLNNGYEAANADGSLRDVCDMQAFGGISWQGPEGGILATVLSFSVQL